MIAMPDAQQRDATNPEALAALGAERAIEILAAAGRTALVVLQRDDRVGEVWLDRGRMLCTDDLDKAAAILAELLAWPNATATIVPGARRPGPCAALPAVLVRARAKEITKQRRALLLALKDPTELRQCAPGAAPREGDLFERAVLDLVASGPRSVFELVAARAPYEATSAALFRLIDRGVLVRTIEEAPAAPRGASAAETVPGSAKLGDGIARLFRWVTSQAGDAPKVSRETASPSPGDSLGASSPGWRCTEPGARVHPVIRTLPETPGESWNVLPWDRDRCAVAMSPNAVAERLAAVLPLERSATDGQSAAFVGAMERAAMTGLEGLDPFPQVAAEVRRVLSNGANAFEVSRVVESSDAITRAVMRSGSAAAYGRPATSIDHAVVRLGLGKIFRIASARALDLACFAQTPRRHLGVRSACLVAGELAAELVAPDQRESAFLAGLMHGFGKLFLVSLAAREARGCDPARVDALVSSYQTSFGVLIAARWGLDRAVSDAVATYPDALLPSDSSPGPLARAVRTAQIVATGLSEDPPVPEWRIARALRGLSESGVEVGPIFTEARTLFADLRR